MNCWLQLTFPINQALYEVLDGLGKSPGPCMMPLNFLGVSQDMGNRPLKDVELLGARRYDPTPLGNHSTDARRFQLGLSPIGQARRQ